MAVHAQTTCTLSTIPAKTSLLKGHFLFSDGYANVIENVANSSTGWGSNVHIGANGIQLRYNNVILSEWAAKTITPTSGANISPNFTFYYPEESSSGVVRQGISALKITTDGLTLYKNTIERVEENRIAAQLNSNGLTVKRGGIKGGTPGYNEFIYLSTENFSDIINNHAAGQISIDGYIKNNWRQIIGNRFAVDSEGYLYADSAILSGQAIAQAGFEVRTQLNDYNSRVAVFDRNIKLGDFLYIRNLSGSDGRAYVSDFTTLPSNGNSYSFTLTYSCLTIDPEDVQVIVMVPFEEEGEEMDSSYYNIISGSNADYNMYKDRIVFNSSAISEWRNANIEIRYYTNSPYARTFTFGTRGEVTWYDYLHIEEDECRPHYDPNYPTGALTATLGVDCIAEGFCSIAIGDRSSAIGNSSISEGKYNTIIGDFSSARGFENDVINSYSHVIGTQSASAGNYSVVLGYRNAVEIDKSGNITLGSNNYPDYVAKINGGSINRYGNTRQADANITADGKTGITHFLATSSMSSNKPTTQDGHIIHMAWDNTGGWDSQIYIANGATPIMRMRSQSNGIWGAWKKIYTENEKPSASDVGAVPTTRTVNSKALSSNITLSASDVGAVPTSRTVNGKALSANISLTASDVGAIAASPSYIEFTGVSSSASHGGYIDFHNGGSSADYTSRIIEDSFAHLKFYSDNGVDFTGGASFTGGISSGGYFKSTYTYNNPGGAAASTVQQNTIYISSNGNFIKGNSASSRRYKHNIEELINKDLDPNLLYKIPIIQFVYNTEYLGNKKDCRYLKTLPGFIAEDIYDIYPVAADISDEGSIEGWNEHYIIPPMLALIQDQHKEIELLKQEINQLKQLI